VAGSATVYSPDGAKALPKRTEQFGKKGEDCTKRTKAAGSSPEAIHAVLKLALHLPAHGYPTTVPLSLRAGSPASGQFEGGSKVWRVKPVVPKFTPPYAGDRPQLWRGKDDIRRSLFHSPPGWVHQMRWASSRSVQPPTKGSLRPSNLW
jgi:hypothetical protein